MCPSVVKTYLYAPESTKFRPIGVPPTSADAPLAPASKSKKRYFTVSERKKDSIESASSPVSTLRTIAKPQGPRRRWSDVTMSRPTCKQWRK